MEDGHYHGDGHDHGPVVLDADEEPTHEDDCPCGCCAGRGHAYAGHAHAHSHAHFTGERVSVITHELEHLHAEELHGVDAHGNEWFAVPGASLDGTIGGRTQTGPSPFPLADTFLLESNPGADHTIYLDFTGHTTTGTSWNDRAANVNHDPGDPILTPEYDTDGVAGFSDAELTNIQTIWQRVTEDFAPFDVNVTTVEPADVNDLIKSGAGDDRWGVRVAIGGNANDWFGSPAGGVAYLDSFNWGTDTPTYVFSDNLGNGREKYVAEAVSHEVGHTLDLRHDGLLADPTTGAGASGYFDGHGSGETGWAPIMGVGYYENVTQWSIGEYLNADNQQDDIAIITTNNGFGFRADEAGNDVASAAAATPLTATTFTGAGVINYSGDPTISDTPGPLDPPADPGDLDFYSFNVPAAGTVSITIDVFEIGPNLDVLAYLYDPSGQIIGGADTMDGLGTTVSATASAAGTYYLSIDGTADGNPELDGYSDYGSIGQYSFTGTIGTASGTPSLSVADASATEGDDLLFTWTLDQPAAAETSFGYAIDPAGATPGVDFVDVSGTVTVAAGQMTGTIAVPTREDNRYEGDESLYLYFTDLAGLDAGRTAALGTILDNDPLGVSVVGFPAPEGEDMTFLIALSGDAVETVTVDYATADVTAAAGEDYVARSGTLTFQPGENTKQIDVEILRDFLVEGDEFLELMISNASGATITAASDEARIIDVDDRRRFTVGYGVGIEGDDVLFEIELSAPALGGETLSYVTSDETAVAGVDYTAASGQIVFAAGQTVAEVRVPSLEDAADEPLEYLRLTAASDLGLVAEVDSERGVIYDNDEPLLSLLDASVTEGGVAVVTWVLDQPIANATEFDFRAHSPVGGATPGVDYEEVRGTVSVPVGATTGTIEIQTFQDADVEPDETFRVTASGLDGRELDPGRPTATVTILNDDVEPPRLSVSDAAADEGGTLTFTVTLSAASSETVTVDYATADGTAAAGDDYAAAAGTLTFAAGETSKAIAVVTNEDYRVEGDETLTLALSGAANAVIADAEGLGTIADVDTRRSFTVSEPSVVEGGDLVFTVTLSAPAYGGENIQWGTSDGTATRGDDYVNSQGGYGFLPGQETYEITVNTLDDNIDELAETINLRVAGGFGLRPGAVDATGTITDNDRPTFSFGDASAAEGDTIEIPWSIDQAGAQDYTFGYDVLIRSGNAAAGVDFEDVAGTVTIPAGTTSGTIAVPTFQDALVEGDETFSLTLNGSGGLAVGDRGGEGTILDDDLPAITLGDASVTEGGDLVFEWTLDQPGVAAGSFDFAIDPGTAAAGDDFADVSGTVNVPAGTTSGTITVATTDDLEAEDDETLVLFLSNLAGLAAGDTAGDGLIRDNDVLVPEVSVSDAAADEGGTLTFTVSLSAATTVPVSVGYATFNGTALAGADFTAAAGTLTFAPGETSKTVDVAALEDDLIEEPEYFTLSLRRPEGVTLGDGLGGGTIGNVDGLPRVTISDATATEGGTIRVLAELSHPARRNEGILLQWRDGTATDGDDFRFVSSSQRFQPGETSMIFENPLPQDDLVEGTEFFVAYIDLLDGLVAENGNITLTILDDDVPTLSVGDASVTEGGDLEFAWSLDQPAVEDGSFDFSVTPGTATAGVDYTAVSGTINVSAGDASGTIVVSTAGDSDVEPDETLTLELSGLVTLDPGDLSAVGTILNDDVAVPDVRVLEAFADEGADLLFTVTLSEPTTVPVTVDYATGDGSALAGADYAAASGTLTFAPGETSKTVAVAALTDDLIEDAESLRLVLSDAAGGTILKGTGEGTISNVGGLPRVSVRDATVTEGGALFVDFVLSHPARGGEQILTQYVSGTATNPEDFVLASASWTFLAGETGRTVRVETKQDALVEGTEFFTTFIDRVNNLVIDDREAVLTILDDDVPTLSVGDASVTEGGDLEFAWSLDQPAVEDGSFDFSVTPGTATAGVDYTAVSGTINVSAGDASGTIVVSTAADSDVEPDETLTLELSGLLGLADGDLTGEGVIVNDDAVVPAVSVSGASAEEGEDLVFTVTLSEATTVPVSVDFNTADGTALAGDDYAAASGTLTFAPGETSKTVAVATTEDSDVEADELMALVLQNPVDATIAAAEGEGTILNDDAVVPTISVGDATVAEGGRLQFRVLLSEPTTVDTSFDVEAVSGTAVVGDDFQRTVGTVNVRAGATDIRVSVQTFQDADVEPDETLTLVLGNLVGLDAGDLVGDGLILNDDAVVPEASVSGAAAEEGEPLVFTVTLSEPTTVPVTVDYATADGTADASDYAAAAGTLTFAPGETSKTVAVATTEDSDVEADETLTLTLSNPAGLTVAAGGGTGVIRNDDVTVPALSIADAAAEEGEPLVFRWSLSEPTTVDTLFEYALVPGTAEAGSDYQDKTGTVTVAAGSTAGLITVASLEDSAVEADETFTVRLRNPQGLTVADGEGLGTIQNDDVLVPQIAVSDAAAAEGDALTFTITLSEPTTVPVTVDFDTADGTAAAGEDYVAASGSVTFAPGETAKTVTVDSLIDYAIEGDEAFTLNLSGAAGGTIAGGEGVGTIADVDNRPTLNVADARVAEGGVLVFDYTLSAAVPVETSFDFALADGTAAAGDDYVAASGTVTIPAGATSGTIGVQTIDDAAVENTETLTLDVTAAAGLIVGDGSGLGEIVDNDQPPADLPNVRIYDRVMYEGNTFRGGRNRGLPKVRRMRFNVRLDRPSDVPVTVTFQTRDGLATVADNDYRAASGSVTFEPGQRRKTVVVEILGDDRWEFNEWFFVDVTSATNANVADGTAVGVIRNDDRFSWFAAPTPEAGGAAASATPPAFAPRDRFDDDFRYGGPDVPADPPAGVDLDGGDWDGMLEDLLDYAETRTLRRVF